LGFFCRLLLCRLLLCRWLLCFLRCDDLFLGAPGASLAASATTRTLLLGAPGTLLATSTTGPLDLRRQCHPSYQAGDAKPCHHVFDFVLVHLLTPLQTEIRLQIDFTTLVQMSNRKKQ
jgi:hypothetical protein